MKGKRVIKLCSFLVILIGIGIVCLYYIYPQKYKQIVESNAAKYGLDPLFVYAIIQTESRFQPEALSRSGAKGLMQIMDGTGEWGAKVIEIPDYTAEDLFNPHINIEIGCWYISKLIRQYEGDKDMALLAYNAGSGNVAKWKSNTAYSKDGKTIHTIPFKETDEYIKRVNFHYAVYKILYRK